MTTRRWGIATAALALLCTTTYAATATQATAAPGAPPGFDLAAGEVALVRLQLPDTATLDRLAAADADIAAQGRTPDGTLVADLVLTGRELDALVARGARPLQLI